MSLGRYKIHSRVLCEDVRQEKSNKFIVIGIYIGDIQLSEIPGRIPLTFFIDGVCESADPFNLSFRYTNTNGDQFEIRAAVAGATVGQSITLPGPKIELQIERPGEVLIEISDDDGQSWETMFRKKVESGAEFEGQIKVVERK